MSEDMIADHERAVLDEMAKVDTEQLGWLVFKQYYPEAARAVLAWREAAVEKKQ